jgi:RHS repeat-associated protein
VVKRCASRFFLLAAFLWLSCLPLAFARPTEVSLPDLEWPNLAADTFPTASPKTRVGGSDAWPSGRFANENPQSPEIATGSGACAYKTAAGRREWLNRDPLGEMGGINLYRFVGNDPINQIDPNGEWASEIADWIKQKLDCYRWRSTRDS